MRVSHTLNLNDNSNSQALSIHGANPMNNLAFHNMLCPGKIYICIINIPTLINIVFQHIRTGFHELYSIHVFQAIFKCIGKFHIEVNIFQELCSIDKMLQATHKYFLHLTMLHVFLLSRCLGELTAESKFGQLYLRIKGRRGWKPS